MKKKQIKSLLIIIFLFIIFINIIPQEVFSDFKLDEYNNITASTENINVIKDRYSGLLGKIEKIGSFVSVVILIIIGIKYMISSIEERAEYKNTMAAYMIGAVFIFGTSKVLNLIINIGSEISEAGSIEKAGNVIVTLIATVGSLLSVIMLVILGIRYMGASVEEKAIYKKTLTPYAIGAVLVFAASTIASIAYDLVNNFG